ILGLERHREQFEHALLGLQVEPLSVSHGDMIEMQPRPLALPPAAGVARFPGITVHEQNEALVGLGIPHVAHPDDGILKVSRNDLEIFAVERQELEIGHGSLACDCVSHACTSGHYGSKVQAYSDT